MGNIVTSSGNVADQGNLTSSCLSSRGIVCYALALKFFGAYVWMQQASLKWVQEHPVEGMASISIFARVFDRSAHAGYLTSGQTGLIRFFRLYQCCCCGRSEDFPVTCKVSWG